MGELLKFLKEGKVGLILLLLGVGFWIFSIFTVATKPFAITPSAHVFVPGILVGAIVFVSGVLGLIWPQLQSAIGPQAPRATVRESENGMTVHAGSGEICVRFGKLEEIVVATSNALVVLPANEYFDDDCVQDKRSALGSFVQSSFGDHADGFLDEVRKGLQPGTPVLKTEGMLSESYGAGRAVFLQKPLGTAWRLLVAAVTTQRAGVGLRAEVATVFQIVGQVHRTMCDHRISEVYLPLLGAGHGGLTPRASLFCLAFGFADFMCRQSAHEIRQVNIVVFRRSPSDEPVVPTRVVKRVIATAVGMFGDS